VPLCREHHRELHRHGDEAAWWRKARIDPNAAARVFWLETHPLASGPDATQIDGAISAGRETHVGGTAV
jgi:hypothetical protein